MELKVFLSEFFLIIITGLSLMNLRTVQGTGCRAVGKMFSGAGEPWSESRVETYIRIELHVELEAYVLQYSLSPAHASIFIYFHVMKSLKSTFLLVHTRTSFLVVLAC
jgi:hypothetical protein